MENRTRITNTTVADALPLAKEYVIWDAAISGFGLRVRPTGGKSYIFTYRTAGGRAGRVQRVTIGNALKLKADPAREQAKALAGQYHGGGNPAADVGAEKLEATAQRNAPTVAQALDRFIKDHAKVTLKEKTWKEYERISEKILKPHLGKLKVAAMTSKDVSELYHSIREKPTQASLAVRVLSSAMGMAEEWGLRDAGSNPCRIRLKGSRRRERLFSDTEVSRLLAAIDAHEKAEKMTKPVALGLRLLFATGCRAGEICSLQWSNVDLEERWLEWREHKTDGGGSLRKVITREAARLLESAERIEEVDWVCPSPALKRLRVETLEAAFERVMKAAKVPANENATLHLIRHWFATATYSDPSIPLPLQMAIVGHRSVATAMRYAHVAREAHQKAALSAEKKRSAAIKAGAKRGKLLQFPKKV
ncbi:tyrosine-type recombinase/integrase [Mesorhizobium sp. M0898]|uniref:tyrosine-type recombinase/integrase n=1 Tax=Mesorhizobium sp. M0898 TaxID=2957020 RepID=UPI00333A0B1B